MVFWLLVTFLRLLKTGKLTSLTDKLLLETFCSTSVTPLCSLLTDRCDFTTLLCSITLSLNSIRLIFRL